MRAAGSDDTQEEGSEAAELNGFSSLSAVFAQRCKMCRATDTLRDISPPTQTLQISIALSKRSVEVGMVRSLIRGRGWGREAWAVEGEEGWGGVSGEIWEIPEALVQRRQDLKLLRGLYLYSFLHHLLTDPRDCVNSSAPWEDSEADNETTLCVPVVCAHRAAQNRGDFTRHVGDKGKHASRVCCELCLDDPSRQQVWLPSEREVTGVQFPIFSIYSVCWQFCILKHFPT